MNNGLEMLAQGIIQNNLILLQGLGMFALTRYTKDVGTACKAGLAMLCTMLSASIVLWTFEAFVPVWYGAEIAVIPLIAFLSAMLWQKIFGAAKWISGYDGSLASGLLDTALVGMLLFVVGNGYSGPAMVGYSFSAALGYGVVLIVLASIRERLDLAPVPRALQGIPILLITAGLLALAMLGFRF